MISTSGRYPSSPSNTWLCSLRRISGSVSYARGSNTSIAARDAGRIISSIRTLAVGLPAPVDARIASKRVAANLSIGMHVRGPVRPIQQPPRCRVPLPSPSPRSAARPPGTRRRRAGVASPAAVDTRVRERRYLLVEVPDRSGRERPAEFVSSVGTPRAPATRPDLRLGSLNSPGNPRSQCRVRHPSEDRFPPPTTSRCRRRILRFEALGRRVR